MNSLKAAKFAVTVMTLLIFLTIGAIGYLVITRGMKTQAPKSGTETAVSSKAQSPAKTDDFNSKALETKEITLPSVSTIQLMSPYKDGVALYVATPKGDFIYFADPVHGLAPARISIKRQD